MKNQAKPRGRKRTLTSDMKKFIVQPLTAQEEKEISQAITEHMALKEALQNLGKRGTDKITGFTGVIINYSVYITGCEYYLIIPYHKGYTDVSNQPKQEYIDRHRVEIGEQIINRKDVINPKLI